MRLFVVTYYPGWGHSLNVVQAESREQAIALVSSEGRGQFDVEELPESSEPKVLWFFEDSPDSRP